MNKYRVVIDAYGTVTAAALDPGEKISPGPVGEGDFVTYVDATDARQAAEIATQRKAEMLKEVKQ